MDPVVMGGMGALAGVAAVAAFRVRSLPYSEAFKKKPEAEQRRAFRTIRICLGAYAALMFGAIVVVGYVDATIGARPDKAALKAVFEELARETTAMENDFTKSEEQLGGLLDPARMITADGSAAARNGLAQYGEAIKRFEAGKQRLVQKAETKLGALDMSPSDRETLLGAFRRSSNDSLKMLGDFLRAKRDIVAATGDILDLIQARRGGVTVKDGQFVFADAADARRSAEITARVSEAVAREETIGRQLDEKAQEMQKKAQKVFAN